MKSDIVRIDNQGNGFADAVRTTQKVAEYQGLNQKETTQLKIITEEMLSLVRSVTGEMKADFWLEGDGKAFDLCLSTKADLDKAKRYLLISSTSSGKNDAARSLGGKLRDVLENALMSDPAPAEGVPEELQMDVLYYPAADPEWDKYERSVLRGIADDIRIGIRGRTICMTVTKRFPE